MSDVRVQAFSYEAPPVEDQPLVELENWEVFRVGGTQRLIGTLAGDATAPPPAVLRPGLVVTHGARITSEITRVSLDERLVYTASGRRYKLLGEQGPSRLVHLSMLSWCQQEGYDITELETIPLAQVRVEE